MKRSENIESIAAALAKAQSGMKNVARSAENSHFRSKYATLGDLMNGIRAPFQESGLSIIHTPVVDDGKLWLESYLMHESGQWIGCRIPILVGDKSSSPQAIGSAITYAKRYAIGCLTGIADEEEDDDGEYAEGRRDIRAQFVDAKPTKSAVATINDKQAKLVFARSNTIPGLVDKLKEKFGEISNIPASEMDNVLHNIEIARQKHEKSNQPAGV